MRGSFKWDYERKCSCKRIETILGSHQRHDSFKTTKSHILKAEGDWLKPILTDCFKSDWSKLSTQRWWFGRERSQWKAFLKERVKEALRALINTNQTWNSQELSASFIN